MNWKISSLFCRLPRKPELYLAEFISFILTHKELKIAAKRIDRIFFMPKCTVGITDRFKKRKPHALKGQSQAFDSRAGP